jgi:hypothetical protein
VAANTDRCWLIDLEVLVTILRTTQTVIPHRYSLTCRHWVLPVAEPQARSGRDLSQGYTQVEAGAEEYHSSLAPYPCNPQPSGRVARQSFL